jgi:hypothetical protein
MDDLNSKLCAMNYVINDTQTNIGTLQTQYFLNETPTNADIQKIKENYSEIRHLLQICNVTLSTGRYQATEGEGMKG